MYFQHLHNSSSSIEGNSILYTAPGAVTELETEKLNRF